MLCSSDDNQRVIYALNEKVKPLKSKGYIFLAVLYMSLYIFSSVVDRRAKVELDSEI